MAKYIERRALFDALYDADAITVKGIEIFRNFPAADVRPVVRCKDCEYCRRVDEFEYWCDGFCSPVRLVRKDDFCSHGKAKE